MHLAEDSQQYSILFPGGEFMTIRIKFLCLEILVLLTGITGMALAEDGVLSNRNAYDDNRNDQWAAAAPDAAGLMVSADLIKPSNAFQKYLQEEKHKLAQQNELTRILNAEYNRQPSWEGKLRWKNSEKLAEQARTKLADLTLGRGLVSAVGVVGTFAFFGDVIWRLNDAHSGTKASLQPLGAFVGRIGDRKAPIVPRETETSTPAAAAEAVPAN